MVHCRKGSVIDYLQAKFPDGPTSPGYWSVALRVALQIAEAISFLHDRLVIFTRLSVQHAHVTENEVVKITDFHHADIFYQLFLRR
jgi:hypothetical protein